MKRSYSFDRVHPIVDITEELNGAELVLADANVFDGPTNEFGLMISSGKSGEDLDRCEPALDKELETWGWYEYLLEGRGHFTPGVREEVRSMLGLVKGSTRWYRKKGISYPWRRRVSPLEKLDKLYGLIGKCCDTFGVYRQGKEIYSSVTESRSDHSLVSAAVDFYRGTGGRCVILTRDLDVIRIFAAYQELSRGGSDLVARVKILRPLGVRYWEAYAVNVKKVRDEFLDDRIVRKLDGAMGAT